MECQVVRSALRARSLQLRLAPLQQAALGSAADGRGSPSDRRLYHHHSGGGGGVLGAPGGKSRALTLLTASPLSANRRFTLSPPQTRTVIISKVIEVFREANVTSPEGLARFILESAPVSGVSRLYEWSEATTGLPCGANIVLCSAALQLLFNTPAIAYLAKWMTRKEKHAGDMVAIKASLMRSPSREAILNFARTNNDLAKAYGCQNYKLYMTILYQVAYVTLSSFGVRAFLMNQSTGASVAMLPWGVCLGAPDAAFILPIINAMMNLLVVEVAAWKQKHSDEGLKMTLRRASTPFKPRPLYLLNLRRFITVPLLVIYGVVPSGLVLHWTVMATCSINTQILLCHSQTRRKLNIPTGYFETDKPFRDFLQHLRKDVEVLGKKA